MKKTFVLPRASTLARGLLCAPHTMHRAPFQFFAVIFVVATSCAYGAPAATPGAVCFDGKCDSAVTERYEADLRAVDALWPGQAPLQTIEEAFRVTVQVGDRAVPADTHLFGVPVNVIPYHDADGVTDVDGNPVARGDAAVAAYFPPGEIGIAVKHHRSEHRTLVLGPGGGEMKEHFKLQDTHIEIVVGVTRNGQPGIVTLNNPQNYEGGRFGTADYPMIFLRPVYPSYLGEAEIRAFRNNMRTMMAGFNAVSNFPGNYNGGDPLAARTPDMVREHSAQMVRAIAGDEAARAWFRDPANLIYCAELAHVSMSAGMIAPLNAETFVPLVGQDTWNAFVAQLERHNAGEPSAFTTLNQNTFASLVELTLAPSSLRPAASYAPDASDQAKLAFTPMTMADIVDAFLRTHLPRQTLGEALAPLQGAVLAQMKPALLEAMAMDQLPESDPRRMAVEALFAELVRVVSTPHDNYEAFRTALGPFMSQARTMTGPRDGSGNGLFVPPSLMHLVAMGRFERGLLGLEYVGHGLHWSVVRPAGGAPPAPAPTEPTDPGPTTPPPTPPSGPGATLDDMGDLGHGESRRYVLEIPAGVARFSIDLDAMEGDPDLYVRFGQEPTEREFDCRPYEGAGTDETCPFNAPQPGTYHVMVHGYSDARFSVRAVY